MEKLKRFLPREVLFMEIIQQYRVILYTIFWIMILSIMAINFKAFNFKIECLKTGIEVQNFNLESLEKRVRILDKQIVRQQKTINTLEEYNHVLVKRVYKIKDQLEKDNIYQVKITYYVPDLRGINSDSDPSNTATMSKPVPGYTIALSTELVHAGWLGQKIYIDGLGVFHATDRMSKDVPGTHIDICVGSRELALSMTPSHPVMAMVLLKGGE